MTRTEWSIKGGALVYALGHVYVSFATRLSNKVLFLHRKWHLWVGLVGLANCQGSWASPTPISARQGRVGVHVCQSWMIRGAYLPDLAKKNSVVNVSVVSKSPSRGPLSDPSVSPGFPLSPPPNQRCGASNMDRTADRGLSCQRGAPSRTCHPVDRRCQTSVPYG